MKKLYSIISFLLLILSANATVHTIKVSDFDFTPASLTVSCGDTLEWVWVDGKHTTTSVTIPVGASPWNANIDSATTSFMYQVVLQGTYYYECTFHAPNMSAKIGVVCPTGIPSVDINHLSNVYPNPFCETITVQTSGAEMISIYNLVGEKVKSFSLKTGQIKVDMNVAELKQGVYFYSIIKDGIVIETRKLIKNQ